MADKAEIITLTDDQGKEVDFEHIDTIEMNDKYYVILLPVEDPENGVVILKLDDLEDDEVLVGVEDDEEADAVLNKYLEMIENDDEAEEE